MEIEHARLTLRALLNLTWGSVGEFVPVPDVVAASGFSEREAMAGLHAAAARKWCYVKRGSAAASRWGVEFAMDWTHVPRLLRAILNSSGGIDQPARFDVVIAASGLSKREVHTLCEELRFTGLSCTGLLRRREGDERPLTTNDIGPCVTARGWAYLCNGFRVPEDAPASGVGGLLDAF